MCWSWCPSAGWAERLGGAPAPPGGRRWPGDWAEAAAGWPVVVGPGPPPGRPCPRLAAAVVLDAHDEAYRSERTPLRRRARWWPSGPPARAPRAWSPRRARPRSWPSGASGGRVPRALERAGWPAVVGGRPPGSDPRTGLLTESAGPRWPAGAPRRRGPAGLRAQPHRPGPPAGLCAPAASWPAASAAAGRCRQVRRAPGVPGVRGRGARWCAPPAGRPGSRCSGRGWPACARSSRRSWGGRWPRWPARPGPGHRRPCPTPRCWSGTEAVLHRVRRAAAVAFLDFDQHLLAPRFGAAEEALALLARAGRLVGGPGRRRAAGPGSSSRPACPTTRCWRPASTATRAAWSRASWPCATSSTCPRPARWPWCRGPGPRCYAAGLRGVEVADLGDGRWLVRAQRAPGRSATPWPRCPARRPGSGSRSIRSRSEPAAGTMSR